MRHNIQLTLPPPNASGTIHAVWDDETGHLTGDTELIYAWAEDALEDGYIVCPTLGGHIPATNPLHHRAEFCALIGLEALPTSLKAFYPGPDYPGFEALPDNDALTEQVY